MTASSLLLPVLLLAPVPALAQVGPATASGASGASTTEALQATGDQPPQTPPAQDAEPPPTDEPQDVQAALADLHARLGLLEDQHADQVDDLQFEIEGLHDEIARIEARSRTTTQRLSAFNPAITVFGNFVARSDDRAVYVDNDPAEGRVDDQFNLREVELDFRAAIDPWADGVLIASYESEVAGDSSASIEEGYVMLKKLPYFDSAPGGLKLQIGRFRTAFGRFNQIHLHDLPQSSYPNSLNTFLGAEGTTSDGMSGQFFLPSPSESQTLETTVAVINGGSTPITAGQAQSNLSVLARLKWFADFGQGQNMELGLSGLQSDTDHRLFGADATLKWKPHASGQWHSFLIGGEVFQGHQDDPALADAPLGFYLWSQYQFNRNAYLGVRFDRTEDLADSSLLTHSYGTYFTYYTTEFLRLRLGVEHTESDLPLIDGLNTILLELNFIFGSHPVEPYWVNR